MDPPRKPALRVISPSFEPPSNSPNSSSPLGFRVATRAEYALLLSLSNSTLANTAGFKFNVTKGISYVSNTKTYPAVTDGANNNGSFSPSVLSFHYPYSP